MVLVFYAALKPFCEKMKMHKIMLCLVQVPVTERFDEEVVWMLQCIALTLSALLD